MMTDRKFDIFVTKASIISPQNSHKFIVLKFHDTYKTVLIFFRISPISKTIIIFIQTSLFCGRIKPQISWLFVLEGEIHGEIARQSGSRQCLAVLSCACCLTACQGNCDDEGRI